MRYYSSTDAGKKGQAMEDENRGPQRLSVSLDAGATKELIEQGSKAVRTLFGPAAEESVNGLALGFDQEELRGKSRMSLPRPTSTTRSSNSGR
jgi:hypothetical protein